MRNRLKKVVLSSSLLLILSGVICPAITGVVQASSISSTTVRERQLPVPNGKEVLASELKLADIILINGVAYDTKGNAVVDYYGESRQRGKLSWAVKAIKASYNKVPAPVKGYIAKYSGLEVILGYIDHFTGAVEDAIYQACKYVGMPDWMAWTVSKALTLLI